MITTRFAPSPTGDPHIGNIRTALFSYLFAKTNGGKFLLRIEDTDRRRHNEASTAVIIEALKWLKIVPENIDKPMIQSKRLEIYRQKAFELLKKGNAYVCTCTPEQLKEARDKMQRAGRPPMYSGRCRDLGQKVQDGKLPAGAVIRIKVPKDEKIAFEDLVRGRVEFDSNTIDDQIILKSDGYPTYHLAHIVDDFEMQVTDVIRSEEWLSSTPKHILLNKMLGYRIPRYAHLPIILGPRGGKLSKRDGAVGILRYRQLGYLPEALVNFMAFLGWNPKDEREFFTLLELEKEFNIKNVNKAAAIFDIERLNFINRHYLQEKSAGDIVKLIDNNSLAKFAKFDIEKVVALAKDRMEKLSDFEKTVSFLLDVKLDAKILVFKKSSQDKTLSGLKAGLKQLDSLDKFDKKSVKAALEQAVSDGLSAGDVFWPVRVALSGLEKSPPPEEIAAVLGKTETINRIKQAIQILNS